MNIIRDAKKLGTFLTGLKTRYGKVHVDLNTAAVSVLVHAAEHGNNGPLNMFFGMLKTNDKDAFRRYVSRMNAVLGGWKGEERTTLEMQAFKERGAFLTYGKGLFNVIRNDESQTAKAAKKLLTATVADQMATPDGKLWKPFTERNNFAETKQFGEDQLRQGLANLIKTAKGERKNVRADVPMVDIDALIAAQKIIGEPVNTQAA